MEENPHTPTVHQLRAAAFLLGSMASRVGDSYDVLEAFSQGFASRAAGAPEWRASAAYTTPGQMPAGPVASAVPDPAVAQAKPAPPSREELRLQLVVLADLRAAVESVIEWRVDDAREAKWSWAQIAEPLDITKQGAHKRYMVDRVRVRDMPPNY